MIGIYLCSKEQEAMNGIPHLQSILYIKGLRPHMDIKTGIVGQVRGISWQSLGEALFVEPAAGIVNSGSPSKQQLRTAANGLIKAGLITSMSMGKKLIFKCVLAETDISKQNKLNTKLTREVNTSEPNTEAKNNHKVNIPKTVEVNTPPRIRDLKSSTSSVNSISQDDDDKNLIFPKKLHDKEVSAIRNLLKGFNTDAAQIMLDELIGHMSAKQINSPVGYFKTIVRDAKNGIFQPERALRVAEGRARQIEIQKQHIASQNSVLTNKTAIKDIKQNRKDKPSLVSYLKNKNKTEVST